MQRVTFYFDLGSPYAYLAAERLGELLGEAVDWQPILLGALFGLTGRSSWSLGDPGRRQAGIAEIERRACEYALPALRWPDPWPANTLTAMRAATYALMAGRAREFALCAFREAFQRGRDLTVADNVWRAGELAGLQRSEMHLAVQDPAVKQALREATDRAHERGVIGVPTIAIDGELFWGDDRLGPAAEHLQSRKRA